MSRNTAMRITLVIFVRLFDLRLFGPVCFLFLLVSWKGCGLWLWHSLIFLLHFIYMWAQRRFSSTFEFVQSDQNFRRTNMLWVLNYT